MAFKDIPKEYKLIVAGGRDFNDYDRLHAVLFDIAERAGNDVEVSLVSGMAQGADKLAHHFAQQENVVCYEFPADWDNLDAPGAVIRTNRYGKQYNAKAGHDRNAAMAEVADGLLAFWDGRSTGTKNMIETMQQMGKPVQIERY